MSKVRTERKVTQSPKPLFFMKKEIKIKRMKPVGSGRKKGVGSTVKRIPNDKLELVEQVISGNVPVKMKTKIK